MRRLGIVHRLGLGIFLLATVLTLMMGAKPVHAQAKATASGPGAFVSAGGGVSAFQADYGQRVIGGGMIFVDVHPTWRYGIEAEARFLNKHTDEGVKQTDYLVGPQVYLRSHAWRPYGKFLVGVGEMDFPFGYAHGNYLALAPGGGVDYVLSDRLIVRAIDFEYQSWPKFTYGSLHPYGLSAGISFRINAVKRYPRR